MPITTSTMKAACIHSFGGPDVIAIEQVPVPRASGEDLLIEVFAAGVNPVDWKIREGHMGQLPLPMILGTDFSGIVADKGPEAEGFEIGEPVFGQARRGEDRSGSYAEYCVAPAEQVTRKPDALTHAQAAALPIAGLTAWQALFDAADLQSGQTVLIHGAAGGVGGFAVQFAKLRGARMIGTASARNEHYVRELGADEVIDYRRQPFDEGLKGRGVDVVLDTIGGQTQERSWRILNRGGVLVSIVQPPSPQAAAAHGARGILWRQTPRGDQLAEIARLAALGKIRVELEATIPLDEARRAQELSQTGHVRGKIVVAVRDAE